MQNYPKIYHESKLKASVLVTTFLVIFFGISFYNEYKAGGEVFTPTFFSAVLICLIILILMLRYYPAGILELYEDHLVYKKGNQVISSTWADVTDIVRQRSHSRTAYESSSFFIVTRSGRTKLIDTSILKLKNGIFNAEDFFKELTTKIGKPMMIGDVSIGKYGYFDGK